jgi:hypothetical protein
MYILYVLTSKFGFIAVISVYPIIIQIFNVAIESSTITGTKYAAMESASFWIGAWIEREHVSFIN